jgi:hypothetical protein
VRLDLKKIDFEEGRYVTGSGLHRFACFDSDGEVPGVTTRGLEIWHGHSS